eukprot:4663793-Karenia_brevis.AAC.1
MGVLVLALAQKERQNFLSRGEDLSAAEELRRDTARIHSCEGGAGLWVEAIPGRQGLRLNDAEFRT